MRHYADIGDSVGNLLGAFINRDTVRQKGYKDGLSEGYKGRYDAARAMNEALEAEQKRRSLGTTLEDLLRPFGLNKGHAERVASGDLGYRLSPDEAFDAADAAQVRESLGPQMTPQQVDQTRRAMLTKTAFDMGGGNVSQIMEAMLKGQRMNAQDMALGGQYDPEKLAGAVAAAEGKPVYSQGANGILQQFTGALNETPLSRARVRAEKALAGQRGSEGKAPAKIRELKALINDFGMDEDDAMALVYESTRSTPRAFRQIIIRNLLSQRAPMTGDALYTPEQAVRVAEEVVRMLFKDKAGGLEPSPAPSRIPDGWTVREVK